MFVGTRNNKKETYQKPIIDSDESQDKNKKITGTRLEGKSPGGCDMKATQREELEEKDFRERDQREKEPGMRGALDRKPVTAALWLGRRD